MVELFTGIKMELLLGIKVELLTGVKVELLQMELLSGINNINRQGLVAQGKILTDAILSRRLHS